MNMNCLTIVTRLLFIAKVSAAFSHHRANGSVSPLFARAGARAPWRRRLSPNIDAFTIRTASLLARPRSKWDDLADEENDEDSTRSIDVPPDMLYDEANVRRQADTYDQLESIGGEDVVNDVYVRAPGEREWWLVGKVARISDVSPEQAIERQWPLIERHVWALRLPVRPTSNLSAPFEVWHAPGYSELDAARNDPRVKFSKVSNLLVYDGANVPVSHVGFVGKVYDERRGEPVFFVERNVSDGSCLRNREVDGKWVKRSELNDQP